MKPRTLSIIGMIVGGLLLLSPISTMLITVLSMQRAFDSLSGPGIGNPQQLSANIGHTLVASASVFVLFPLGVILFTVSIVYFFKARRDEPPPGAPSSGDDR